MINHILKILIFRQKDNHLIQKDPNQGVFIWVVGSIEISDSLKEELLELGSLCDYIEDCKKYANIVDSCSINTINWRPLL